MIVYIRYFLSKVCDVMARDFTALIAVNTHRGDRCLGSKANLKDFFCLKVTHHI